MDACWAASKEMLKRHRGICLECHDECLPKPGTPHAKPRARKRPASDGPDPRLFFASPHA